jgi:hypothetical protein
LVKATLLPLFTYLTSLRTTTETGVLRFYIFGDHPFIVSKDHRAFIFAQHIAGTNRSFAAPSRNIYDKLRHSKTGGVAPQVFDDLYPFTDRSAEMGDSP